jgi:uncharacterized damage-inducible protein DinB
MNRGRTVSTRSFLHTLLSREQGIFARVIAAVPAAKLDYRPDPKARSARELVEHLLGHHLDLAELITEGSIHHRNYEPFASLEIAERRIRESYAAILGGLSTLPDSGWGGPAPYYEGESLVMEAPREQLAWMFYLGAVHHRGQLSTYLRPMGATVPAIYGPSADDPGGS